LSIASALPLAASRASPMAALASSTTPKAATRKASLSTRLPSPSPVWPLVAGFGVDASQF